MAKTKNGIWAKMLAHYAKDADPEEVAEAVEAIDEIVSEEPKEEEKATDAEVHEKLDKIMDVLENLPEKKSEEDEDEEEVVPEEKTTDEEPDKQDIIIDLLKKLVEKNGSDCGPKRKSKDEEPDALEKLEEDIDEIAEGSEKEEAVEDADEEEFVGEEEETFAPDEDTSEPEAHFVEPEEINETDSEEEPMAEKEYAPTVMDRKARDAMKAAIRAVKPMIAMLPPRQRKIAADAAARSIRRSYGLTPKATRNSYTAIQKSKVRRASDSVKRKDDADLAKRIMKSRNVNYKK